MSAIRPGDPSEQPLASRVAAVLDTPWAKLVPVAGNWGLTVWRAETPAGRFAVKAGHARLPGHLVTEARMLAGLAAAGLPVPTVLAASPDMLVMEWIEHDAAPPRPIHERAAGEALVALHAMRRTGWGYPYPTQIGSLALPNEPAPDWLAFYRDRRLRHFAALAAGRGLLDVSLQARLERLADRLDRFIAEPGHPALLHGDVWLGNVLTSDSRLAAFVDPALTHGDPEVELAYVTLHGTFGRPFFEAYAAHQPIAPEFHAFRRDLYLIVPLLQHALLSGPAWLHRVDRILRKLGL